jgi:hypothetical protein
VLTEGQPAGVGDDEPGPDVVGAPAACAVAIIRFDGSTPIAHPDDTMRAIS